MEEFGIWTVFVFVLYVLTFEDICFGGVYFEKMKMDETNILFCFDRWQKLL